MSWLPPQPKNMNSALVAENDQLFTFVVGGSVYPVVKLKIMSKHFRRRVLSACVYYIGFILLSIFLYTRPLPAFQVAATAMFVAASVGFCILVGFAFLDV